MPNTIINKVNSGESIHAETKDTGSAPALYASNVSTEGTGAAIFATAKNNGIGMHAKAVKREGLVSETLSEENHAAIAAYNQKGAGAALYAENNGTGNGIDAISHRAIGLAVQSFSNKWPAIFATNYYNSKRNYQSLLDLGSAIRAENYGPSPTLYAISQQGKIAGYFDGSVHITKQLLVNGIDMMDKIASLEKRIKLLEG